MQPTLEHSPAALEHPPTVSPSATRGRRRRHVSWLGGGTAGNEQLVATLGVVLIALFAVMGITILRIHQLLDVHMFVGILLAGPVGLKLGATGYRFTRYYSGNPAYRRKGPPKLSLRLLAPVLVLSTLALFLSGLVLMLEGASRSPQVMLIHKASFLIWISVAGLHVPLTCRGSASPCAPCTAPTSPSRPARPAGGSPFPAQSRSGWRWPSR